jgi:hypothetical protein
MMSRLLIAFFSLCLTACSNAGGPDMPVSTPVPLYSAAPDRHMLGELTYRGGIAVSYPDRRFGGWSALEIGADGSGLLAVSDSAYWMSASLFWTSDGWLSGLGGIEIAAMLGADGRVLTGDDADSEAIANLGDGRYAVSFERNHRINAYPLGDDLAGINSAHGQPLPVPPGTADLPNNGGLEGLTPLADGEILAAIEYPQGDGEPRLLWRFDGSGWHPVRLEATPDYGLTSLTHHGGYIYALERYWRPSDGNRIRIIRFPEAALVSNAIIEPELLGELGAENTVDNFEGIAVLEREGETLIVIMSDDNYNTSGGQRTLLLAFALR